LDGDGIETLSINAGIYFDHDGKGLAESTGWIATDDGFLVLDKNSNGKIDSGNELFGANKQLLLAEPVKNGFLILAAYDNNKDGVINTDDLIYSDLRVWKDLNSNGISDDGELFTLVEAGVKSIVLSFSEQLVTDSNDNQHLQFGQYLDITGVSHSIEDVWFKVDTARTTDNNPVTINDDIAVLPNIEGFGNVYSLHKAMQLDTTGVLKNLVVEFIGSTDVDIRGAILNSLIYTWAGVQNIDPNSRAATQIYGNVIGDARKLEALEEFLGEEYVGTWCWGQYDPNPHGPAAKILLNAFDKLSEYISSQLLIQTQYKSLYDSIGMTWNEIDNVFVVDVSKTVILLKTLYDANPEQGLVMMEEFSASLKYTGNYGNQVIAKIRESGTPDGIGFYDQLAQFSLSSTIGNGSDNRLIGTDVDNDMMYGFGGNDAMYGGGGNDTLDGGSGNDYLQGGSGSDTYVFSRNWGKDEIFNADGEPSD
jgi:Ca2+-binding RTX toxin-like protein